MRIWVWKYGDENMEMRLCGMNERNSKTYKMKHLLIMRKFVIYLAEMMLSTRLRKVDPQILTGVSSAEVSSPDFVTSASAPQLTTV
jgi:hypothetical protein